MNVPKIAPHESCVACFRGDTTTIVCIRGEAEFIIAAMHQLTGLSLEEAQGTFQTMAEQDYGCDPGRIPAGVVTAGVRLCGDCAAKTGARVVEARAAMVGEDVFTYMQPDSGPLAPEEDESDGRRTEPDA